MIATPSIAAPMSLGEYPKFSNRLMMLAHRLIVQPGGGWPSGT
jgi:hypothetical protein